MVRHRMPGHLACHSSPRNRGVTNLASFAVTQQLLKISRDPTLNATFCLLSTRLECCGQPLNHFGFHTPGISASLHNMVCSNPRAQAFTHIAVWVQRAAQRYDLRLCCRPAQPGYVGVIRLPAEDFLQIHLRLLATHGQVARIRPPRTNLWEKFAS
jgi:hypothetical protein